MQFENGIESNYRKKISPEPFDEFLLPWKIVLVGLINCQNAEVLAMFLTVALAKTPRPANAGQNEFGKIDVI